MTGVLADATVVLGLLFVTGVVVSLVNSVSGGGSVLSLPLFLWLGLPAAEANGTNRFGTWLGSLGGAAGFYRYGVLHRDLLLRVGVPGLAGSLLGAFTGVFIPESLFRPVLAFVILFVVVEAVRRPGIPAATDATPSLRGGFWPFLAYAGVGFYGGFIQAGVGLVMLYTFSRLGNLNLFQVNALKVSNNLIFATLSVAVFGWFGKIRWDWAVAFALGNIAGGYAGSVLQMRRGEGFVRVFVGVTGAVLAMKLFWDAVRLLPLWTH